MDLNSTRTAANTITPAAETQKPKYGERLLDYYAKKGDSLADEYKDPARLAQLAYEKADDKDAMDYDTWSAYHGIGDFVEKAPTIAATRKEEADWKASQPESRGSLATVGTALGRGAMDFVSMAGGALSVLDGDPTAVDTHENLFDTIGGKMSNWADTTREKSQALRTTKEEESYADTPGFFEGGGLRGLKNELLHGTESVTLSAGTAALGAGIGLAAAPVLGVGAGAAAVVGGLASLGAIFFGGTYDKEFTEQKDKIRAVNPDASEQEIIGKTKALAAEKAGWEAGSEVLSDLVSGAIVLGTGGLGAPAAGAIKTGVKGLLKPGLKTFLKRTAVGAVATVPSESGTEMLSAAMQDKAMADAGLEHVGMGKAAVSAFIPSLVPSIFFGVGGASIGKIKASKLLKDINSEDIEARAGAVNEIAAGINQNTKDKELATSWLRIANQHIIEGKPIDVNEDIAAFAAANTRTEAAAEGNPIEPTLTPEEMAEYAPSMLQQEEAPLSPAESLLTDGVKTTPTDVLMGTDAPSVISESEMQTSSPAAGNMQDAQEHGLQQPEADLDTQWQSAIEARDVAAQDRMLAVEWEAGERLRAARNTIAQVDAKKGRAKKQDLEAKRQAQQEVKQIVAQYPNLETMLADPTRNMVPTTEEARAMAGTLPPAPEALPPMDKQSAAKIAQLEKRIANIEGIPAEKRGAKRNAQLENYKMELATLRNAAQPLPLMEGDYGQAGAGNAVGGLDGAGAGQGAFGQVGAVSEVVPGGISTGVQPDVAAANFEQGQPTLAEVTNHVDGIHDRLVADGVLTQDEVDQIRTLDVDDPDYVISSRRQELITASHVRAAQQRTYARTVGRILKGGGIDPGLLIRQHGNDGAQWLRSRFGLNIIGKGGNALDVWAQILTEEVPEADIRGESDRLYSLLREEWPTLKKINDDYRDYTAALREDIKTARTALDEREAYRQGNLSPAPDSTVAPPSAVDEGAIPEIKTELDAIAHEAATSPLNGLPEPTQAQKEAGNYKKAHVRVNGLDFSIENPKGSERKGVDKDGTPWSTTMRNHYAYIKGSVGADKDHVDAFLSDAPESGRVFIVDQIDPKTGAFDEHKAMVGFETEEQAREAYLSNYEQGWQGLGAITPMEHADFKKWVFSKKTKKPVGDISKADRTTVSAETVTAPVQAEASSPTTKEPLSVVPAQAEVSSDEMSEQFTAYARFITDTKNKLSDGLREEIARDVRLKDGEADALLDVIKHRELKEARTASAEKGKPVTTEQPSAPVFTIKPISEKAFVVTGDTKPIKDKLKSAGGRWMSKYTGWMFPERHRAKIEKLLGLGEPVRDDVLEQAKEKLLDGYKIEVEDKPAGKFYKMVAPDGKSLTYVSPSSSTLSQKHADQLLTAMVEHFTGQRTTPDRAKEPAVSMTSTDGEVRFDVTERKDGRFAVTAIDIDSEKVITDVRVYSTREAAERYARDEFEKYEAANKVAPETGEDMDLPTAQKMLTDVINEINEQGRVADDRLIEKRRSLERLVKELEASQAKTEQPTEKTESTGIDAVVDHFAKKLYSGAKYDNIVQARKEAAEVMGEKVQGGTDMAKIVDEAIELAIVKTARRMIKEMRKAGATDLEIYQGLVALYAQQPNLGVRTSTSVAQQAYSTPVPIAFLASSLAGINNNTRVLEPTAGNGMLLIEADNPVVNELNPDRAARLRSLGFKVGEMDAASEEFVAKVKHHVAAVVANPPFGRVRDENGEAKSWTVAGYETKELDHAIALRSLELLLPDGKAVLIIGGKQGGGKNRALKYHAVAQRQFYKALFDNFKVVDHFTVDGKLYAKQGAGFPIDVIVIDGRGKTEGRKFPAAAPPRIYESFAAMEELFNEKSVGSKVGSRGDDAGVSGGMDGDRGQGKPAGAGGDTPTGVDTAGGRTGAGGQGMPGDSGKRGADRPLSGREGTGEGGAVGDLQSSGQAGTGKQAGRDDGGREEGLSAQAEQADAGLVQADDAAGVGGRSGDDVSLEALMGEWDRQEEASKPKEQAPKESPKEKTASERMAESAASLNENLQAALDVFSKFGGLSVKVVKEGDPINQSLYEAIRPHLLAAYKDLKDMGLAGADLIREFVAKARAVFGAKSAQARPYFEKFAGEIVEMERKAAQKEEKSAPVKSDKKVEGGQSGTALQDPYSPRSKSTPMGTLVPKNMTTPLREALDRLEAERGNIDQYVAKELGYSQKELEEYFAGEQVDAIALAIHNIDKGAGFIIGDQTGIGKGRVNAAIMRYAKRKGAVPVFVTMKPDLYADMVRDLQDIGMQGFNPLPTNGGLTGDKAIPLPDGRTLRTAAAAKHSALLDAQGKKGVSGYDAVFTTYSQLQSVKGKDTARRAFIRQIAPNAIFILDESHNAGGAESSARKAKDAQPTTAEFVRDVLGMTDHGVFYSSATYAKRPDVMSLYFKTDMRYAVDDISALSAAISEGGIPLQQIVAAQLTESGQYIRRERSFEGASVEVAPAKADMKAAEQSATIMRSILAFDKIKQEALAAIKDEAMGDGEAVGDSSATGEKGANSTNFTSVMHNLIGQSLLAMKADAAVDAAIEARARGEKPIITLANTMGSFIEQHVTAEGVSIGQEIFLTFKDLYRRYLEKTRTLTKRDARGKIISQRMLTDEELGPEGVAAYNAVLEEIERSNFGDLPISPIDYITSKLNAANISVGEITGRTATVDYSGGIPVYRSRRPSPAANIETMRSFNSGQTDVIILNQSGSTGISLHSSSTFADTNKRTMIIVQPELNIDVFMQTLGRVFRTGQVVPPAYKLLTSDLPAEKRPAAVLGKKMAGLNANTTASRKTDTTFQNIPDFLNEYGDLVTAQIMEENPEIHTALGSPLKEGDGGYERDGAVRKVTGRIPMLPLKDQQDLYDMIEGEYNDLIAQLEATGTSTLEAKTLQLDAKLISTADLTAAKDVGGTSPFAAESKVGLFDVKSLGKPYAPEQVRKLIVQGQENKPDIEKTRQETVAWMNKRLESIKGDDAKSSFQERVGQQYGVVQDIVDRFEIGSPVAVSTKDNTYEGVVVKMEHKGSASPSAPSAWKMTIAIADSARQLVVPFSKLQLGYGQDLTLGQVAARSSNKSLDSVLESFSKGQTTTREKRYIAYGNVLAAYSSVGNQGQIVNFEDSDGNTRAGIMFKKNATLGEIVGSADVSVPDYESMVKFFDRTDDNGLLKTADKILIISRKGGYWNFHTSVGSKAKAGQFFLNGKLMEAAGRQFVKHGNSWKLTVHNEVAAKMISVLRQQGFGIVAGSHITEAREVMGLAKKGEEKAAPQYQAKQVASTPSPIDLRAAFPWADSIEEVNGKTVVTKGKVSFTIEQVETISANEVAFRASYGRNRNANEQIAGEFLPGKATIRLSKVADQWTVQHEYEHFLEDMGLITPFERGVLDAAIKRAEKDGTLKFDPGTGEDRMKPAELRAYYVQHELAARDFQRKTTLGRVLQKVADFIDALANLFVRTSKGVVRDVASGKMMGRESLKADVADGMRGFQTKDVTETEAFKKWFGKSKVVDEKGKPLVVYHGTDAEFDAFDMGRSDILEPGVFFTSSKKKAGRYGANVMPAYLSFKNPYVATQKEWAEGTDLGFDRAISDGYDGYVVEGLEGKASYIAFNPTQIKSVNNRGTFDPADPRIQYALAPTLQKAREFKDDLLTRPEVFGVFNFINTQLHKALRQPAFRRVFDRFHAAAGTQQRAAARAASLAPDILPDHSGNFKQSVRELFTKTRDFSIVDLKHVSRVMSMETLSGKDASPFSGHRLTDDELTRLEAGETITVGGNEISMNAKQMKLYRQSRAALDQMLTEMATSEAWRIIRGVLTKHQSAAGEFDARDYWEVFANQPNEAGAAMQDMLQRELEKGQARLTQSEMNAHAIAGADDMDGFKAYGKTLTKLNKAIDNKEKFSKKQLEDGDLDEIIAKREERIEKLADELGIDASDAEEKLKEYKGALKEYNDASQHVENVNGAFKQIEDVFNKSDQLIKAGYAPLSRFGKYRIDVLDDEGKLIHVSFYDSSTEAARERRNLVRAFDGYDGGANVGAVETVSQEDWKQFQGANPEALRLFAQKAGADSEEVMQAYYQSAISSRSALKRLINRQGYAGYSEDLQRIMASFITSGSKRVGSNYHAADIAEMVNDKALPADLRDEASKLKQFIDNPGDAGSGFRSFAANWYMLGSMMSAAWNGTQVFTSTTPELYKHGGSVVGAFGEVLKGYRSLIRKGADLSVTEKAALKRAMEDGTVDAAEIHHLYAQATKRFVHRLGDGEASKRVGAFLRLWGMPFSWFEVMNRKASFIAAYRMGEAQGADDAYAFAKQIVDITQGIYAKHNRPNMARGAVMGSVMTFMQYKIMTLEQIARNAKEGGQARKAAALQLAIIAAMGGWKALPGIEDITDLYDTIMQTIFGKAVLSKKSMREAIEKKSTEAAGLILEKEAAEAVGQFFANAVNNGIVTAALPVDVSGRAGMGGLIPGLKLLKPSTQYRDSIVFDMAGVPGSMIDSLIDASGMILQGDMGRAAMRLAPNAVAAVAKGADILATGEIRNTRGKKVTDGSPLDAALQTLGGQPKEKSRINNRLRENQELKFLTQAQEKSMVQEWADAYEKKGVVAQRDALLAVRKRIADWNAKNPNWPIVVKQSQVMNELKNRKKTTVQLASKSAPKELRQSMAVE